MQLEILWVNLLSVYGDVFYKMTHLIPRHPDGLDVGSEGGFTEHQLHRPTPVHHEVKSPPVAGKGEARVVGSEHGHPDPQ